VSTDSEAARHRRDRCTTPDGVGIEVYDFGGRPGRDLVLVHATGFCAEVFTPLAAHLAGDYHCWGLDLRAHGRSDRPADGDLHWDGFATDVATVIDHLGLDRPAGFGHSCGGAAVLLAEEARHRTFSALYCFEPVIFPGTPDGVVPEDNPLSAGARRRRDTFVSAEMAFTNFSSKPPFSSLDPDALMGYIEGGFEPVPGDEGGDGRSVRLRCRREDEAAIYALGFRHHAFDRLPEVACPVTLSCGEHTDSFGPDFLDLDAARLPDARVEVIPGTGHFGPLEQPAVIAESVHRALGTGGGTPPS
jgi:pimeloyl-ACP methyl ester carboxylesterase